MGETVRDRWMARDGEAYAEALSALLPVGPAWPRDPDTVLMRFVRGLAETYGAVDARAAVLLLREADPRLTFELLAEWEHVAGLPDPCVIAEQTVEERRQALVNRLSKRGGASRSYFIGLAEDMGYGTVTLREFRPFMAGVSRAGDASWEVGAPSMRFYWRVNVPGARLSWFRAGQGRAGNDPLLKISRAEDLECRLQRLKPAHTILQFSYEGA